MSGGKVIARRQALTTAEATRRNHERALIEARAHRWKFMFACLMGARMKKKGARRSLPLTEAQR